jgi:hypothetical protein
MHFQTCKRYVVYSHTCMSTYVRVLSPSKTEAGSEDSWLWLRESSLWGGGRTQSDLHSFSISPSLRLRQCIQCVCARVCQCCTRAYPKKQPRQSSTRVNGHRCKEYAFKVADIHVIWKRPITCLCCKWSTRTPSCICKNANDMYTYSPGTLT